jgi:hypothetical protein
MITVFDDLIPASLADKLEEALTHDDTNWNLALGCGNDYNAAFASSNVKDTPQMYHVLVSENAPKSQITSLAMCVLFFLESRTGIFPKFIPRVKANLLFPIFDNPDQYHPPHIDTPDPNAMSLVYYVNDSDGPTRFFDDAGNIIQEVEPKKGRLAMFPSNIPHASSCPIASKQRIVVNFVILP